MAEVAQWLKHYNLDHYVDALVALGLDSVNEVDDLEEKEIESLMKEAGLPKLKHKKLRRAIADLKKGKYKVPGYQFCAYILGS